MGNHREVVGSDGYLGGQEGQLMQWGGGGGEDREKVFVEFLPCAMHDDIDVSHSCFINEVMRL